MIHQALNLARLFRRPSCVGAFSTPFVCGWCWGWLAKYCQPIANRLFGHSGPGLAAVKGRFSSAVVHRQVFRAIRHSATR
jgi:hypothetical protein